MWGKEPGETMRRKKRGVQTESQGNRAYRKWDGQKPGRGKVRNPVHSSMTDDGD